ncbi:S9 family peptidase [Pseudomonas sp. NW5]|uniref:S9 family peptidase n=1 Tax=Pseudomonas sp. NW5 TaxID=2934934 RepID=UPI00201FE96F|nr:S9 family peptidase [Pseudomonas sp. NW5]MCL7462624.1 S9 family peptidase [Pseudomonas sp. NW5]
MSSTAPRAHRQPGSDPYAWLEQRDAPEVLAHLQAENAWLDHCMADSAALREQLFEEIRSRIRETDLSLPVPWGPWLYYQRTCAGEEYPRHYRCARPADDSLAIDSASETLLLDLNALAGEGYIALGGFVISPDHRYLAYSLDTCGDEIFTLHVKDLETGALQTLPFSDCDGSLVWANDSQTLFFATLDDTHRPYRLQRYRLGEAQACCVFEESDGRFFLDCHRASSERQLILLLSSKTTSEAWVLDAEQPLGTFTCLAPREEGHEYYPDHGLLEGQYSWLIRSNQAGINFALYRASETQPERAHWQPLIGHRDDSMLESVSLNAGAFCLERREAGLPVIEVHPQGGASYRVQLPDAAYSLEIDDGLEFTSTVIRLRYEALNRPAQIRQLQLASGLQQVLKEMPVEGPFEADAYLSLRLWATAADGTQVPISLVGRREILEQRQSAPLYLYGYGAYGESLDPWFSHARLSLLERGFLFAIAHVRGGGELGEAWYRAGKLAHKQNSFDDFIACAESLIQQGYTTPHQLAISGGSAGGLLIGAVLNQRPELFAAAIAEVPFVDILNTMQHPELPLTITEYDEWGDPTDPEVHARIAAYAPYENVRPQAYPAILAIAGYHDSRVQYWEAAKWVARLRECQRGNRLLLLKTDFSAGHGGMSGRYQALRDAALEYAFLFKALQWSATDALQRSAAT